jgi:hypothetical protein
VLKDSVLTIHLQRKDQKFSGISVLFESSKIENHLDGLHMGKWDGTFKSVPCQEDIYSYVIKYKGIKSPRKVIYGKILLIK